MMRYKVKKEIDRGYLLAKKQERIRYAVSIAVVSLWLACIVFCGILSENNTAVGLAVITVGLINCGFLIFSYKTRDWEILTPLTATPELYRQKALSGELLKEEIKKTKTGMAIIAVCLVIFTLVCFICGFLKLFSLI